ncbi:MAG: DNA gyrase inhibitor YacG [Gammaproteobacteria bacterium]|nr:DNA gyrase inhibitor YacG [Gammaproteobacteria bacterium]NND59540.1 DNA gyrase inhibitor YacG [Gammaproteobacteria bacterium]
MQVKCPTCRQPVEWTDDAKWRPFCSERCRLIDLGEWFNEQHRIADEGEPEFGSDEME